eukprot:scaffold84091_cov23-Tisochrysis_lutea.AAC.6
MYAWSGSSNPSSLQHLPQIHVRLIELLMPLPGSLQLLLFLIALHLRGAAWHQNTRLSGTQAWCAALQNHCAARQPPTPAA